MALIARNNDGVEVYSWEIEDKKKEFFCRDCGEQLGFVDADLKIKHFRHKVDSHCEPEPETFEHVFYKKSIFEKIKALNVGHPKLEHWLGKQKADIYWEKGGCLKYNIVIEVQASNYNLSEFEQKINAYAYKKNLIVIYVFVGNTFCYEIKKNIYSLKEIEKRIFIEKKYLDTVVGAYISGEQVRIPVFKNKYARGHSGHCSNRFIMEYRKSRSFHLEDYLREIYDYVPHEQYNPICPHNQTKHVKHNGKIIRYKIICEECNKFQGWLPNNIALSFGYNLKPDK
jgi:hypothetical protein